MPRLFQRLKLAPDRVDYARSIERRRQQFVNITEERAIQNAGPAFVYGSDSTGLGLTALEAYLAEDHLLTERLITQFREATSKYFFGAWRDQVPSGNRRELPPDRDYQDRTKLWEMHWSYAIVWFSSLNRWNDLLDFASYLRDDVVPDPEQSKENRAWLLFVAKVLRGDPREETQPLVDTIFAGRRKREKLLYRLFDAILEGDEESANGALKDYSTYYRATEFPGDDLTKKVAFDASFLVHYAEYRDMEIQVPPKMVDHIVRFPPEVLKEAGC